MQRRMLLRTAPFVLAPGIAVTLAGCARPVANIENDSFVDPGSFATRTGQIIRAGTMLGWRMQEMRPGVMRATLDIRTHQAVVDITYDAQRFSIAYVDSTNLNYDGTRIHPNYNGWVRRLADAIAGRPIG